MARSKTAQPKHSLRKIAVVVATAVSGMSVYAQAAVEPKEDTITVTAAPAPQESAWGPAATIAARQSATGTKTDTPIQKVPQSISVVTAEEMALHQPKSVKEALSYTPGVSVGTRGASNTYDHLIIRGFAAEGQSQNNYLNGLKLQGNFYNDAVIDPYMLERAEIMRGPVSVLYGKSSPGGLLNMVSKRPTTEPLKEVQFKAGTDSLFQTGFDFSDALDDDGVYSYRLTGLARSANAQQKGSEEQRYAIAPAFTWRPDDKTNFTFLSYFQNEPETGYYGWLPKEGTVEPLPNGKRLPTDFNEGAKNNTYSRNEKMVGYSFDHEFNDTFTVRQNLRFAENKTSQNSVYGYGVCSDPANAYSKQCAALAPADKGHYLARKYVVDDEKLQNFSVDAQPLESWSSKAFARKVAYLPQQLPPAEGMTVRELVAIGRYPWHGALGRFGAADREKVEEAISLVGLKPLAHRLVDSLSGGERQRAWIAMLVAQDSRCLLLDEPTSALDIAHQVDVLALVHRLSQERGLTVIAVLHDINMAARYCDYLVALRGGEMIAQGTPAEIMRGETLEMIYGIPMGILPHPAGAAPVSFVY